MAGQKEKSIQACGPLVKGTIITQSSSSWQLIKTTTQPGQSDVNNGSIRLHTTTTKF